MPLKDTEPPSLAGKRNRCAVINLLESLDDKSQAVLQKWIDDPAWSSNDIRKELVRQGIAHDIREGSMQRHRRYDCTCRPQP